MTLRDKRIHSIVAGHHAFAYCDKCDNFIIDYHIKKHQLGNCDVKEIDKLTEPTVIPIVYDKEQ